MSGSIWSHSLSVEPARHINLVQLCHCVTFATQIYGDSETRLGLSHCFYCVRPGMYSNKLSQKTFWPDRITFIRGTYQYGGLLRARQFFDELQVHDLSVQKEDKLTIFAMNLRVFIAMSLELNRSIQHWVYFFAVKWTLSNCLLPGYVLSSIRVSYIMSFEDIEGISMSACHEDTICPRQFLMFKFRGSRIHKFIAIFPIWKLN